MPDSCPSRSEEEPRVDAVYHVSIYDYDEGHVLTPGRWGQSLSKRPMDAIASKQTLCEIIWEFVRQLLEKEDSGGRVSRLKCVFACANVEFARYFRDGYVPGASIYEVEALDGARCTTGDFGLITWDTATIPIAVERAQRYWSGTPVQIRKIDFDGQQLQMRLAEVLVGGSVKVIREAQ